MDDLIGAIAALVGATAPPEVLAERPGRLVVRFGDVVVKVHAPDPALDARLALASHPALAGVILRPSRVATVAGRTVSVWPAGRPVEAPEIAPWVAAGELLARLHLTPLDSVGGGATLPPAGGPARLARAIKAASALPGAASAQPGVASAQPGVASALRGEPAVSPGVAAVLAAFACLPPGGASTALVHGDWHLGQLVELPSLGWRLSDVDDLGLGDPAWDLGRPAAWYACGLLEPEHWFAFLTAYRAAGGPAVPADGDPWPALDGVARALTVQSAAQALTRAATAGRPLDEAEDALVDACARMIGIASGE